MTRFTVTDDGRVIVHGSMGERDPLPDEVELIRDALPAPDISVWWAIGSVAMGILAMVILGRGIGA